VSGPNERRSWGARRPHRLPRLRRSRPELVGLTTDSTVHHGFFGERGSGCSGERVPLVIRVPRLVITIAVGVAACAAAQSADAAGQGKPDPSPAAVVSGLRPDPAPSARLVSPQQRTDQHAPPASPPAPSVVTPTHNAPTRRPRGEAARPATSRHSRARTHAARSPASSPAFTAMLRRLHVLPTSGRLPAPVGLDSSAAPARGLLLAAAGALAAVVLASGSLLVLASRRSFWTGA
jgi:hypothetical protein